MIAKKEVFIDAKGKPTQLSGHLMKAPVAAPKSSLLKRRAVNDKITDQHGNRGVALTERLSP